MPLNVVRNEDMFIVTDIDAGTCICVVHIREAHQLFIALVTGPYLVLYILYVELVHFSSQFNYEAELKASCSRMG